MAADVFRTARVSPYLQRDNFSVATLRTVLAGRSTQERSLLLLLSLRHVLFTLVYLISWRKSCTALAGLPHCGSC